MDYISPITSALTNAAMQNKQWPSQMAAFEQQRLSSQGAWNPLQSQQNVSNGLDTASLAALIGSMGTGTTQTAAAPTFNVTYSSGSTGSGGSNLPSMDTNYNIQGGGGGGSSATAAATPARPTFSGWGDNLLTNSNYGANAWNNNAFSNAQSNNPYYTGLH